MTTTLSTLSTRFATQLLELTEAIARGEDIDHRLRVLREYARTWMSVAEVQSSLEIANANAKY